MMMKSGNPRVVEYVSECFIKPHHHCLPHESKQPFHLSPWDLMRLSIHYIQKGLLYAQPQPSNDDHFMETLVERLKSSLSLTLSHFYPLAGRLKTLIESEHPPSRVIYVDCCDSPGARFIQAKLDLTVSDILAPTYVPPVVHSLFDHHKAVNHDGHATSLLSIQVTELADGVFIGCSMNHSLADGTSFWNFLNSWSEIFRAQYGGGVGNTISRPPILKKRWFPNGHGPTVSLPYAHQDEFITRFEAPKLRERIFHFSAESVAKLKAKANAESNTEEISSLQSLSAVVWRCVMRARNPPPDRTTCCKLSANARSRLDPVVPEGYFGNMGYGLKANAAAGDLLGRGLGWAAWTVRRAVAELDDKAVGEKVGAWLRSPRVHDVGQIWNPNGVVISSSPRFDKYGSEFGMGKAVAVRSGHGNKFDGMVYCYPGREGGGSIDLEVSLLPETMRALKADHEFIEAAGLQ